MIQTSEAHAFLPGAPTPEHTLPTTVYKSQKPMPRNLLPADFYATSPEHAHPPLVIMLTVTQFAVGAFGLGLLVERLSGSAAGNALAQAATAIVLGAARARRQHLSPGPAAPRLARVARAAEPRG